MAEGPAELFSLHGRVAIVTGASAGLGEELVRALVASGANVVAAARRQDRLKKLAAELDRVLPVVCDVADDVHLQDLVAHATQAFGGVDVLVNNAGTVNVVPAEDEQPSEFERVLRVNLQAPARLAALVASSMRDRGGGSIINVASISGLVGIGALPQASYVAAKTGLIGLTRELALQWAGYGIRVNALAAGYFESPMTAAMYEDERLATWVERRTPLRRRGQPRDMVGALLLLASDAGSYMTGQAVVVDGGWTAQ